MTGGLRLCLVFTSAIIVLLILLPIQLAGLGLEKLGWNRLAILIPVVFHKSILWLFGVRLELDGTICKNRPLLIVANHLSWLDIVVLGSVGPLSFVAKQEMASWPVLGWCAKLQRTIFIKREARRSSSQQVNEIADRMTAREIIVLFPEGTTTDGNMIASFKTTLFEAAKIALIRSPVDTAAVQPVAINYNRLHGLSLGRADRPHVAWPGEIGLVENLIPLVRTGALDVTLHIGDPVIFKENADRKIIAATAAASIRSMLDSSRCDS